jgi:amino acid transporter
MLAVLVAMWGTQTALLRWQWPDYNFATAHLIPAAFLVFLFAFTGLTRRWERKLHSGATTLPRVFNFFLMWKMSKMVVGVVMVFYCWQIFDVLEFRLFLILFAVFYAVFMGLETVALRGIERRYKPTETEGRK